MRFDDVILYLDRVGVADVLLPFILVFTVVYAVLFKSKVLGREEGFNRFNIILALVMALAVIFPHVTGVGPDIVPIINTALPNIAAVAIALIMFMFLMGIWGVNWSIKTIGSFVVVLTMGVVLYIFGAAAGWGWKIPDWLYFLRNGETQALIITLLVFGLIIGYITKDPANDDPNKKLMKRFDQRFNLFGEGKEK
ncbi:hypothetical protein COV93_03540 [Candidatus Woesearchaeota archaeon CG11_big_fil_rev_8_21_14_0_20_43_8]|nr:MAG: hypothetical protein COV93_03540 [Candidatus Woesearchaeota archaeon CG11_big_fil_rev_8_21_14_0_20_43_8]PIO06963.1 MAG: hypothetical protein COT47_02050 [Candidatus Woesearchaeota archaeon CG08_land_8_20_14_0_20_43_7]